MGTSGGVNVVITRIPPEAARPDPSVQSKRFFMRNTFRDINRAPFDQVFRTRACTDLILSRRQFYGLIIGAIDLRVEEEVGSRTAGG